MTEMIDLIYFIDDVFKLNKPKVSKVILIIIYYAKTKRFLETLF